MDTLKIPFKYYFHFHDKVITPNGPGMYQGRWVSFKHDVPTKLIVSHNAKECPQLGITGIWGLYFYTIEDVKPL